jgi:hypothetical protein
MISNHRYTISKSTFTDTQSLIAGIEKVAGPNVIRWYISAVNSECVIVEATCYADPLGSYPDLGQPMVYPGKQAVLNVVPTGIGCSIGGYAADATPANNLLAAVSDYLITNPNTVNASNFINLQPNVVYAEGHAIDLLCRGQVDFYLPNANKVGLIIEKTESANLDILFNVVNAVRAIYGVNIVDCIVTDERIHTACERNEAGAFVGTVRNPEVLFDACEKLVAKGANAIAVTTNVQNLPAELYRQHFAGAAPNPVGGVEAIISHLLMRRFGLPAAHAPLINFKDDAIDPIVDARGAGEMASTTGLACILVGLHQSPQINSDRGGTVRDILNIHNLLAVVMPASCLGGLPVLQAQTHGIPVIAVQENETILNVTHEYLPLDQVIPVRNYAEAAGIIVALKHGIHLDSLSRPFRTMNWQP